MFFYEMYRDTFLTTYSLSKVEECKGSIVSIKRLIKASSYHSDIKSGLYAFFIEPVPVI